jgi:outer membrane protein
MKRYLFFAMACVLISSSVRAQELHENVSWSLEKCIDYAVEHNISVQQSEISVKQREIALNTAKNNRLPGVSGSTSQNFSFGRGLTDDNTYSNTNTSNTSFNLGADVTLFAGMRISNNIQLSQLNLQSAVANLEKAKDDIRVSVAQAYVEILYNKNMMEVAKNQVFIDSMQVERLIALENVGKASSSEVISQKATLAQSRLTYVQAENSWRLSLLTLSQLLELPSPEGFNIETPSTSMVEQQILRNPEEIYQEAVGTKPVILVEELALDQTKKNVDIAKSSFYPTLSMNGGLGTSYYKSSGRSSKGFSDQIDNNFSQSFGLSLNIPIFSRFSNRNELRTAQLSYNNQQLQLDNVKKQLYKEIQQAYYNALASQTRYQSSVVAAESANASFELVREKYEGGKANITEFNEAKNRYLEAESNLIKYRYEYIFQSSLLDFYSGKEIVIK